MAKDTHRQNFMLTAPDRARLARIKEAHGLRTDTDALRRALALADEDVALDGIGAAAIATERAYRDMVGSSLTPDMPAWWAARHDEQRERDSAETAVHIIPDSLAVAPLARCGRAADMCADTIDEYDLPDGEPLDGYCADCADAMQG